MTISQSFPKRPDSAAAARRALDELRGRVDDEALESARLLVSELFANVVRHVDQDGAIAMNIALWDDRLRVEVLDPGAGFVPRGRGPDSPLDGKWGLHFLEVLSDRWGVDRPGRSRVWFELSPARPGSSAGLPAT